MTDLVEDLSHGHARMLEVSLHAGMETLVLDGDDLVFEIRARAELLPDMPAWLIVSRAEADALIGAIAAMRDSIWPN